MAEGPSLADLGEWELIQRLGAFAPPGQFVDDGALVELVRAAAEGSAGPGGELVISTDVLVEGVHFSDATTAPSDVGWRAAAANLSDLAAMGCRSALGLTVGLVAPPTTPWSWVEGVYGGFKSALDEHGGALLGGDCSGGRERVLAVTALGRLDRVEAGPIRRADGRPGDALVTTGPHGLSRLGLAFLLEEPVVSRIDDSLPRAAALALRQRALQAHQRPQPRFDAVEVLGISRPRDQIWRVAGCDSSDGLAAAVQAIAAASGCGALLDQHHLPLDPLMATLPFAQDWGLAGGEDFELVLALDPDWAREMVQRLPGASRIGELVPSPSAGSARWSHSGAPLQISAAGFTHFQ